MASTNEPSEPSELDYDALMDSPDTAAVRRAVDRYRELLLAEDAVAARRAAVARAVARLSPEELATYVASTR